MLISKRQAKKCNRFQYVASWLENRYKNLIDLEAERSEKDSAASVTLYQYLGEALIALGLFEETGRKKIKRLTGNEFLQIKPVEFYADFILTAGVGYVLFMPSVILIPKIHLIDERIISRVLRESGITGWTVKRVSEDDDIVMFILKDETVSRAYDFTGVEQ